ncbi:MAG: ABC transporter substrate-binding protein, partial [Oscillospiraceae bacterium]|nr:ABC transporter substrate-binding protein [Oscillospiraceae bacterium]
MKKKILAVILVLGMLTALLAGCGGKSETPEKRAEANAITIGIAQDLDDSLDPHVAVAAGTKEVMFNVFEGLVKPTSDGNLVPAVASDVSVEDGGLTYVFTLRQGVKFHNGKTVEMQDVLFSIRRCAGMLDDGSEPLIPALAVIADVQGEGDKLTITLSEPNNEFLAYMTLAILPADYDQQATAPVG